MKKGTIAKSGLLLFTACLLALLCNSLTAAQQKKAKPIKPVAASNPPQKEQEDETRRLWDEGLLQKRRASRSKKPRRNYNYSRVTPALVAPTAAKTKAAREPSSNKSNSKANAKQTASAEGRVVGITFWRLRPSAAGDEARILVQEEERQQPTEWTPERIAAETPLKEGYFVRLSIEAPHSGYLYVIDREKYNDGSLGEPYLIFPTLRTHSGNNRVEAGRIVEIPAQDDNPPYFTMRPSSPMQVAEILTVIITDEPLDVPTLQRNAIKLRVRTVNEWEQAWKAPVERIEQVGGQGAAWTTAEKEAGQDEERRLTQDEPLPQTIYHVAVKPGQPLFINVPLLYGGR